MTGYANSGATVPAAMLQPSPAPARFGATYEGPSAAARDVPGVALDFGPIEVPWHARTAGQLEVADAEAAPAKGKIWPTSGGHPHDAGDQSAGSSWDDAGAASTTAPAARSSGVGPAAVAGSVPDRRLTGSRGHVGITPGPRNDRPVRGPAAAILGWRRGHLFGAGRGMIPPSHRGPAPGSHTPPPPLSRQVGRAPAMLSASTS